jgi:hypothetical protein
MDREDYSPEELARRLVDYLGSTIGDYSIFGGHVKATLQGDRRTVSFLTLNLGSDFTFVERSRIIWALHKVSQGGISEVYETEVNLDSKGRRTSDLVIARRLRTIIKGGLQKYVEEHSN